MIDKKKNDNGKLPVQLQYQFLSHLSLMMQCTVSLSKPTTQGLSTQSLGQIFESLVLRTDDCTKQHHDNHVPSFTHGICYLRGIYAPKASSH